MAKEYKLKRTVWPYIILAIALISSVLILMELWANVNPLVSLPWEGPTPTNTLWWRAPKVTPSKSSMIENPASFSMYVPLETPTPIGKFSQESFDG